MIRLAIQWETVVTGLVGAVGGVIVAYGLRRREARLDRVLKLIDESQTDLLGPMFREVRLIGRLKADRQACEEALRAFFNKYDASTSKIHLFSSKMSGLDIYFQAD